MKRGVLGITLLLTISLLPAHSATPPKSGSTCTKQGATKTYQGKKYTCIKSGKRLIWDKGASVAKPNAAPIASPTPTRTLTASPTPSPTLIPNVHSVSDPVALCKTRDKSNFDPGVNHAYAYGGFVDRDPPVPAIGEVTWYLVPIDFQDLKGEEDWRKRVDSQMKNVTTFYERMSYGKLTIRWKLYGNWITLPGKAAEYRIEHSGDYGTTENFWKSAISEVDKYIDFTNVQTVNFILPKNQDIVKESAQGFPWTGDLRNYFSKESRFSSFTILGKYFESLGTSYWSYWAHEYGHVLGIPHLGGSRWSYSFQPYDLMGTQDIGRDISGWSRFAVTHWIPDEWVYCKMAERIQSELIYLYPLNSKGEQTKLAVIPIDETKTLVVESRRRETNSDLIPRTQEISYLSSTYPLYASNPLRDGVFVYIYDSKLGHIEEYLQLVTTSNNPILSTGDSVEYKGVKVTVLEVGSADKVLLTRKN